MLGIKLIIAILFVIIALLSIFFVIIRAIKNNKNWKIIEPELIKKVQKSTGQEIIHTMTLNASDSTDFSNGKGFLLWIAFTSDYTAFINKSYIADSGNGHIYLSRRMDTSMKRLEKRFMELEFRNKESAEILKLDVLVRPKDIEILSAFIPNKKSL